MISQIKILGFSSAAFGSAGDFDVSEIEFSLQRNCAYPLNKIGADRLSAEELVDVLRLAKGLSEIYGAMVRNHTSAQTKILNWCN